MTLRTVGLNAARIAAVVLPIFAWERSLEFRHFAEMALIIFGRWMIAFLENAFNPKIEAVVSKRLTLEAEHLRDICRRHPKSMPFDSEPPE